jgi:hypothetical protein
MSISAVNPATSSYMTQMAAVANAPSKKTAPTESAASEAKSTPAATVQLSGGVPSSVDADDRILYAQVLKASGNAGAAAGAVKAKDASEGEP